jgi:hypothetical protein
VEALALLARRRERARLLVLGTYRPTELLVHNHPLKAVKQELAAHGQCVELPLGYLRREAVSTYIAQRRAASKEACTDLAAWVYRWTEGHPVFMVQVVDYVEQQASAGTPLPIDEQAAVEVGMPLGLRDLIEAQLGRLTECRRRSVCRGQCGGGGADSARCSGNRVRVLSAAGAVHRRPGAVDMAGWDGEWAVPVSAYSVSSRAVSTPRQRAAGAPASGHRDAGRIGLW